MNRVRFIDELGSRNRDAGSPRSEIHAVTLLLLLYLLLDPRFDDLGSSLPEAGGDEAPVSPAVLALRAMWIRIDRSVHKYIVAKSLVSAAMALFVWLLLGPLLHVHLAHLFGVATFFLNFIPNVGALIAFVAPLPVIFLDPKLSVVAQACAVVLPLAVHVILGAVIEPLLFGTLLQLHPVVVLLALGFWFVLWGVPGAVLAVPITSVLCIAFKTLAAPGAGQRPLPAKQSRYAKFAVRFLEDCVLDFAALAQVDDAERVDESDEDGRAPDESSLRPLLSRRNRPL